MLDRPHRRVGWQTTLCATLFLTILLVFSSSTKAEEADAAHLAAARDAAVATRTIYAFDTILPDLAEQTLALFVRSQPAAAAELEVIVAEVALQLADRRKALNKQIYALWAETFSRSELEEIAAFYRTPAGMKLALTADKLAEQTSALGMEWSEKMSVEMVQIVRDRLEKTTAAE